jgi:hypothetical protein
VSLTGDTFDFQQGNVVTSSAQIVDPGATVGDVLTVQADKSIAAAPGGGSQTLAEVLTAGGDPEGNPVTGKLIFNGADQDSALHIEPTTDGEVLIFMAQNEDVNSDDVLLARAKPSGGSYQDVFKIRFGGRLELWPLYSGDPIMTRNSAGDQAFIVASDGVIHSNGHTDPGFELGPSSFAIWLDPTPGAVKLKIRAQASDGSPVTGEVSLA